MKVKTALIALLVFASSSFSADDAIKKAPYYRPRPGARSSAAAERRGRDCQCGQLFAGHQSGRTRHDFGNDLTTARGVVLADTDPLPTQLAGVQVLVGGIPAPIYGIAYSNGQDQISIQVPYDAPTGPGAAEIEVVDLGAEVADFFTDSFTEGPGIFTYQANFAIAEASDYSLIGPNNPAIPGEPLILYVTGLGPLDINLVDGSGSLPARQFCRDGGSLSSDSQ